MAHQKKNYMQKKSHTVEKRDRIASTVALVITVFLCMLTGLELMVACIWGGDEAIGLGHMVELVAETVLDPEHVAASVNVTSTEQNINVENDNTSAEQDMSVENDETSAEQNMSVENDEISSGQELAEESEQSTEQIVVEEVATETEEEKEARELEKRIEEAEYPFYIKVNREQCCITVYAIDENGEYTIPYRAMICSTGLYNRTPLGTFQISDKYVWRDLHGGVCGQYACRVVKGVLFHSVPYYSHSKNALCSSKYNQLGEQASAGCIRLTVEDAKWIYDNCPTNTTVEIYDDEDPGPLGKPEAIKIDLDSPNKGWDPTDPDEENPWNLSEGES